MSNIYSAINLNGTWQMAYQTDAYKSEALPERNFETVSDAVPGYWEDMTEKFRTASFFERVQINPEYSPQRYPMTGTPPDMLLPNYIGCFFYRRTFVCDTPSLPTDLAVGGAQNTVSAWINGHFIGSHEGYSAPFEMTVPEGVLVCGENTVVLAVSNIRLEGYNGEPVSGVTSRAACECTGGIGNVELRQYNSPIRDVYVTTADDCSSVTVHVDSVCSISYKWSVTDGNTVIKSGNSAGESFTVDAGDLQKWSPSEPNLYTVIITDGEYSISRRFGVRRMTVDGVHLRLNGDPIFLRGICEHGYFPLTAHPCNDKEYYCKIIKTIKSLGFNFIRFHTHIPMPEYLEAADELGIVMHIESPNNTSVKEWREIVRYTRRYSAPMIYCMGNELLMDEPFIEYISLCADVVHESTDALFSPMSAMRGVEYSWKEPGIDEKTVNEPFRHHPSRLNRLSEFCDVYSSFPEGKLSYTSLDADPVELDSWSVVYNKPRLSHEICIHGTYADLSLKERYNGTRIGQTELFTSVEAHLKDVGLLERAPIYYANSSEWQRRLRKHTFEVARRCEKLAGFDYLGDIDHHWHTFGYHVGMMNEFYELKPGVTVRNVRMYNSDTVLLCTIKDGSFPANMCTRVNFTEGETITAELAVSNYGKPITDGVLHIVLSSDDGELWQKNVCVGDIGAGFTGELHELKFTMPMARKPMALKLCVTLSGDNITAENEWEMYIYPKLEKQAAVPENTLVTDKIDAAQMMDALRSGKDVVLFSGEEEDIPFPTQKTSFRISLAGRTSGCLATVIADHPALRNLPNEGFCGWQFRKMMDGGRAVILREDMPFEPMIEVANTHKFAKKLASLFEYRVMGQRLLVCTLNLCGNDPGAMWLKNTLISYINSDEFSPKHTISEAQLTELLSSTTTAPEENTNVAFNPNDKTMRRKS